VLEAIDEARTAATVFDPLAAALSIEDPWGCVDALVNLVSTPPTHPMRDGASVERIMRTLYAFSLAVTSSGLRKFLVQPGLGTLTEDVARFSRHIGAHEAAEYVERAIALFPGGEVPASDRERINFVARDMRRGRAAALGKLDREYRGGRGVIDELFGRLQSYARSHRAELEQVLAKDTGRAARGSEKTRETRPMAADTRAAGASRKASSAKRRSAPKARAQGTRGARTRASSGQRTHPTETDEKRNSRNTKPTSKAGRAKTKKRTE